MRTSWKKRRREPLVVAVLDPTVDPFELAFELRMEGGKRLFDRRQQNRRADLLKDGVLVLPTLRSYQVVLEAAELVAVADIDVASFKGPPQQAIEQELVAVDIEPPVLALPGLGIHITLNALGDDACREVGMAHLTRRSAVAQDLLQEGHRFEQRRITLSFFRASVSVRDLSTNSSANSGI